MNLSKEAGKNGGRIEFRCVEKSFSKIYSSLLLLCKTLIEKYSCSFQQSPKFEWMNK